MTDDKKPSKEPLFHPNNPLNPRKWSWWGWALAIWGVWFIFRIYMRANCASNGQVCQFIREFTAG
ncbi:hypothetical protein UM181_00020 [Alphaproteobacteria bacterium US3C007]|nr:hypothetical protein UM181_00020 [Alphaproteobacteria bacterium US3C007]